MYRFCKSSPFTSSFLGQRKSDGYDVPAAHSSMSAYLEFSRFLIDILLVSFFIAGRKASLAIFAGFDCFDMFGRRSLFRRTHVAQPACHPLPRKDQLWTCANQNISVFMHGIAAERVAADLLFN